MRKLDNVEYNEYWKKIHAFNKDDIATVCFPDKPKYFNNFFDRIQKFIINKYIDKEGLNLNGKKLLDVGCGRGRWLKFFNDRYNADVCGVDLSPAAAAICREKGFKAYEASITDMDFDDDTFDFVTSITVLLHLPYSIKESAISEIYRILKPGGKLIIIESTWEDPSPHVFGMKIDKWEEMFNKYNLSVIHKSGHCFNIFRRFLPQKLPFRDYIAISLDYPLEYFLMNYYYGKKCDTGLQHLVVLQK